MARLINTLSKVPARWYGQGRPAPANVIVLHTTESPEKYGGAVSVAYYFNRGTKISSAHIVVDDRKAIRCVDDSHRAWAAPPLNSRGLHLELVGAARQNKKGWTDPFSSKQLVIAAKICADWVDKYNIKIRKLTDSQLKTGQSGFCGHVDVSRVFNKTDHTDPGIYFPWTAFLERVKSELKSS